MNAKWLVIVGVAALVACVAASAAPVRAEPAPGAWEEVLSLGPKEMVRGAGVDAQGKAWLLTDVTLRFWDGAGFRAVANVPKMSPGYDARLTGGPDRGLFLVGGSKVYALSAGEARYVADYYAAAGARSVYAASDGRLMQWGAGFITPDLTWPEARREAKLGPAAPVAFDDGPQVHVLCNGRLYTVGPDGTVTERPCALPKTESPAPVVCAPWGPGRALLLNIDKKPIVGLDLRTGGLLDVKALVGTFAEPDRLGGLAAMPDGSCLVQVYGKQPPIYRIPPGGRPQELPNSASIAGAFRNSLRRDGAWAAGADGSIWLGGEGRGLLVYKDGQVRTWGWRDGIRSGFYRNILEDGAGTIFAIDSQGAYIFRPDGRPAPLPAGYELWTEVPADWFPVPDFHGGAWLLLTDRPGTASHWDGEQWQDVEVPFRGLGLSVIPDDRGHLLVAIYGEDGRCYDVGPRRVRRYHSVERALEAAVADGARRFGRDNLFPGNYADDRGRIWFAEAFQKKLHYFDGTEWHVAELPEYITNLRPSPLEGMVVGMGMMDTYAWPEGPEPTPITYRPIRTTRLLLGPTGLQPFEEALLRAAPDYYLPVNREGQKYYLLRAEKGGADYVRAGELTLQSPRASTYPALGGGLWLSSQGPARVFAGRVIRSDFADTPLRPPASAQGIFEDRAHNLWIRGSTYFMKRLTDFRLRVGDAPARVGRALTLDAALDLPGLAPGQGYVFWRVDGGDWQGGGPPGHVVVRFSEKGVHRVELLGMETLGGTTPENVLITVDATMPLPETRLTARGSPTVNDVTWQPPVEAVPSEEGQSPALIGRLDGGEWQPLEGGLLLLGGLVPGTHAAEFAAVEEKEYRDASPVSVEFTYAPDYELIVNRRLESLLRGDMMKSAAALRELRAAGQGALDVLRLRLAALNKEAAAADRLRQVLLKIEEDQKPPPEPQPIRRGYPSGFPGVWSSKPRPAQGDGLLDTD